MLAAKPVRSPMTPPPSAISRLLRSIRCGKQTAGELGQMREILGLLARRQDDGLGGDARALQARLEQRQIVPADALVGHDEDAPLGQQGADMPSGLGDQPGPIRIS